jgi:hypothetical protein
MDLLSIREEKWFGAIRRWSPQSFLRWHQVAHVYVKDKSQLAAVKTI